MKSILSENYNPIGVIDPDIGDVVSLKDEPTKAFAHCILRDLHYDKYMSAGVAVKFYKSFSRPKPSV